MTQHNGVLNDARGNIFRADLNNAIAAARSNNSGPTAPAITVAGMPWLDTSGTEVVLKIRNDANTAWTTVAYSQPRLYVRKLADQYIPYSTYTQVGFADVVVDVGGYWNPSTMIYTPPAGDYFVTGQIVFNGAGGVPAYSNLQVLLRKNGVGLFRGLWFPATANVQSQCLFNGIVPMGTGDTMDVAAYQFPIAAGVTIASGPVGSTFSAHRIG